MSDMVHIFNGDSTAEAFSHSTLHGSEYVVREVLCDGPCAEVPGTSAFFETRQQFFQDAFSIAADEYYRLTIDEWHRMTAAVRYDEWVLWFEYDVFCQFNLIGVLASIGQLDVLPYNISLICVGQDAPDAPWKTLAHYAPDQYPDLLEQRVNLSEADLSYAAQAWASYLGDNPRQWLPFAQEAHPVFPYLANAFRHQMQRLPAPTTGLNVMETAILKELETKPMTQRKLIGQLLRTQNHPWGIGDLQWAWYCNALHPLMEIKDNELHLAEKGKQVLAGKASFRDHLKGRYIGGVSLEKFCWDESAGKPIPYAND